MNDFNFLKMAVSQAKFSVRKGGFPVGAVVVKDNRIIGKGISIGNILHDPTSHAESVAIREACKTIQKIDLTNSVLYASLQPCVMCYSSANWARVSRIVYGCQKTKDMVKKRYYEGMNDIEVLNKNNTFNIKLDYIPDFEEEIINMLKEWEKKVGIV